MYGVLICVGLVASATAAAAAEAGASTDMSPQLRARIDAQNAAARKWRTQPLARPSNAAPLPPAAALPAREVRPIGEASSAGNGRGRLYDRGGVSVTTSGFVDVSGRVRNGP